MCVKNKNYYSRVIFNVQEQFILRCQFVVVLNMVDNLFFYLILAKFIKIDPLRDWLPPETAKNTVDRCFGDPTPLLENPSNQIRVITRLDYILYICYIKYLQ
jgi:hypothetical protein